MTQTLDSTSAAKLLHIHEQTLEKMARNGEIPACKPGKAWVYLTEELIEWLRQRSRENLTPKAKSAKRTAPKLPALN